MLIAEVKKLSPMDRAVYWIAERESIRRKKELGLPRPWTDDEILDRYRFCNVRRMDDKVSKWLLTNWYKPFKDHQNMLAAVALARFINKPESLAGVTGCVFQPGGNGKPAWESVKKELRVQKTNGRTVFNGAYVVKGVSRTGTPDKIGTVVDEYVAELVRSNLSPDTSSVEKTHEMVKGVYGYGSFMAGQVVADLRWAVSGSWKDRNTWAPVGPGSARGLARLLYGNDWASAAKGYVNDADGWLGDFRTYFLPEMKRRLPTEITKRLEAHDYQNCLCEYDKYSRALSGEGKPKQLYRSSP